MLRRRKRIVPENKVEMMRNMWKTRRKMTWGVFIMTFILVIKLFFFTPVVDVGTLQVVFASWLTFASMIIGAYFGFATFQDVSAAKLTAAKESATDCDDDEADVEIPDFDEARRQQKKSKPEPLVDGEEPNP